MGLDPGGVVSVLADYAGVARQLAVFALAFITLYIVGVYVVHPLLMRVVQRTGLETTFRYGLERLAQAVIVTFTVVVAAVIAGFAQLLAASVVVVAGLTVAISVAASEVTGNLVSGFVIVLDRSLNLGDWVRFEDVEGEITDIGYRATRVRKFNNELAVIPNSELVSNQVTNVGINDSLRLNNKFRVDSDADIEAAMEAVVQEAFGHDSVLEVPEPGVRVSEVTGSYVELESLIWVDNVEPSVVSGVESDYVLRVKRRFDDEGVEMPGVEPQDFFGQQEPRTSKP